MTGMTKVLSDEEAVSSAESAHQLFFQVMDDLTDVGVHFHAVFHQAAGVKNGAVITAAEGFADGIE
jgi:hypothetical protein